MASDLQDRGLQAYLDIDRDAASRLGVSVSAIDDALYSAFGQRQISTLFTQASQYRVVLEVGSRGSISSGAGRRSTEHLSCAPARAVPPGAALEHRDA